MRLRTSGRKWQASHGVQGAGTHDPEQCHFVAQTASYITRKGSTVAGRFTLKGFKPGNVIFLRTDMKCFGSEGLELIVNRTARFCRHMADTLEATGRFDVVFVPVLSSLLHRADRYHAQGTQLSAGAYDTTGATSSAVGFFANPARAGVHVDGVSRPLGQVRLLETLADPLGVPGSRSRTGEAFVDWPVRLATTHGQSRAHRGELTELGIRLRRSWGDGKADGHMCVTIP